MKFLPLVWAGLWRKKLRTVFTFLSIVVAFFLFGVLHGTTAGFDRIVDGMSAVRLRVVSRVNITQPLPVAHAARIETVAGVRRVAYYQFFGGTYQDPKNVIQAGALNLDAMLDVLPNIVVPAEQRDAMLHLRTGAIIGQELADKYGWKIGDRVPLRSNIWTREDGAADWTFDVVGIYRYRKNELPANQFWINYDYFDEARDSDKGTITMLSVALRPGFEPAEVASSIDQLFSNSPDETYTQNEKQWMRGLINRIGDIGFFANAIIGAVLFALLSLTGNTMMQSVRERIPELAVLKTVGFGDLAVTSLVATESILLCILSAALGLGLSAIALPTLLQNTGIIVLPMQLTVYAHGALIAALLAAASVALPALRIRRLTVASALAGR